MPPEQKQSVFMVLIFAVSIALFGLLIPIIGMGRAPLAMCLMAVSGLAPLLFPRKRRPGEVEWDERDEMIAKKVTLRGAMLSYGTFIAGCMVPWTVCRLIDRQTIPIYVLPYIVGAGVIVLFVGRAIVILFLYGRESTDGQN